MRKFLILVIVVIVLVGTFIYQAYATNNTQVCFCHNVQNNPHTICTSNQGLINGHTGHVNNGIDIAGSCQVTPTVSITPTPSVEVTPTESVTPTEGQPCYKEFCPEDELTPTPTPDQGGTGRVPEVGSEPEHPNWTCTDQKPVTVAHINVTTTGNSEELLIQWPIVLGASQVHIEYGKDKIATYALLNTENDGNEVIRNLTSGIHYWFRVRGVNGCAVGDPSVWFDPIVP